MDSGETPVRGHSRRRPSGRRPLPAHLPRRRVEVDVPDADKRCGCGHVKTRIEASVPEKLEYQPASFLVIETVRAKYACPACHEGVVEAPTLPQAVEESLAAEGLLAHVVVTKYVDLTPLHRLSGIFAREGLDLPRGTLCDWVADVATALAPIDNNRAENQLRVVAVGRKNWLFAGSFEGARRAALLYPLVQSCRLIDVPPFEYLKDVLLRAATHPQALIAQLTPRGWRDTFQSHSTSP